ncbi:MAG: hypothetical protein JO033_06150 [Acidobacteriaceae bacterium]|nr:hypothetical protein [Acidobacteriaceae bacterium]
MSRRHAHGKELGQQLCVSIAEAVTQAREVFQVRMDVTETLDRFWCVQDQLHRLVNLAAERPGDAFPVQEQAYPSLVPDIVELISFARKGHFTHIAALHQSCEAINQLLLQLAMLKPPNPPYDTAIA